MPGPRSFRRRFDCSFPVRHFLGGVATWFLTVLLSVLLLLLLLLLL